ncbi:MAG: serine hydrolase domain-containing protein [Nakamurella sp.]
MTSSTPAPRPRSTTHRLPRSAPSQQGVDAAGIAALLDGIASSGIEVHSLMVLRHGHVFAEGWWAPYTADRKHLVYSLSKTFTSAAAGIAVGEGLFGLDDVMTDHFPELVPADVDGTYARYLVRHALSMSSGHEAETLDRAAAAMPASGDLLDGFFAVPPDREPGSIFAYNQPTIYGVGRLVGKKSGSGLLDYLQPRLFEPLGIDDAQWMEVDGFEQGFSGLHVRTETLAKTGQLVLDGGLWGGRQILSPDWVGTATSTQTPNDITHLGPGAVGDPESDWQQGYGFQYWMCRHGFRGDGAYGQFVIVWPEEDAVIVTTAETTEMQWLLNILTEHLLPAMTSGTTAGAEIEAALAQRLSLLALAVPGDSGSSFSGGFTAQQEGLPPTIFFGGVAIPGLTTVRITEGQDGWTLDLGGVEVSLKLGRGGWIESAWPAADDDHDPVPFVSAAGVGDDGHWRAQLRMIQTPHRIEIDADPATGTAAVSWKLPPLRGDGPAGHSLRRR